MRKYMIFLSFLILLLFFCLNSAKAVGKLIVYIDPGHGGIDGGASVNDITEARLNLEISQKLKTIFLEAGYEVLMTREGNYDLATDPNNRKRTDIRRRVELINKSNCILFLSIHMNTYSSSIYSGSQCFYNDKYPNNALLATHIQNSLGSYLKNTDRLAKTIKNIYLLDHCVKTGCIVECGFMSNSRELALLCDDKYQLKVAQAIFYGAKTFLEVV